ncbi:MAG: LamG-like jellyroll fold domain-containing protein [Chthoniobacteraceae bacterium]
MIRLFFFALAALAIAAHAAEPAQLRSALLLSASFDGKLDADFAMGDATLFHSSRGSRADAKPGLPDGGLVVHDKGAGKHGDALHFTKKMRPVVFFRGEKNLGYSANGWSGAVSFWMRLDPEKDLEPGYCDPLQFIAQGWDEGNMFVEFSKDHTPRHFRYAILPTKSSWNPTNRGWEEIPDVERPMVAVVKPPFTRERWTHVVFCFGNINSGKKDGWGRLYLDGVEQGAFKDSMIPFNWDVSKSALTLGLSYIGWLDDLAVFSRPLTGDEVRSVFDLKNGIRGLSGK